MTWGHPGPHSAPHPALTHPSTLLTKSPLLLPPSSGPLSLLPWMMGTSPESLLLLPLSLHLFPHSSQRGPVKTEVRLCQSQTQLPPPLQCFPSQGKFESLWWPLRTRFPVPLPVPHWLLLSPRPRNHRGPVHSCHSPGRLPPQDICTCYCHGHVTLSVKPSLADDST